MTSLFIAATSLAFLLGLGALGVWMLRLPKRADLAAGFGALLFYTILLCTPSLAPALWLGALGSVSGWLVSAHALAQGKRPRGRLLCAIAISAALALFSAKILGEPLEAWDARSIWFFHAKKIFYNDSLWRPSGWTNPFYLFSHADYPLFVPALAAAAARAAGGWNELAPKLSLLALLAPALFSFRYFCAAPASSAFFLGLLFLRFGETLSNGYLDGYLALYTALSVLHFGAWLEEKGEGHLSAGILFLALTLNLKQEGAIGLVAIVAALAIARATGRWRAGPRAAILAPLALAVLDRAILLARNLAWGVTSDVKLDTAYAHLVGARIPDPFSWGLIFIDAVHSGEADRALFLLLLVLVPMRLSGAGLPRASVFAATAAALYFAGIAFSYFISPYDLDWHVSHSADRVMMPVTSLLFVTFFFCLRAVEKGALSPRFAPPHPEGRSASSY